MIKSFFSPRKLAYPINIILFNLCRINLFRNKRIWVFGGVEGKKYDDNSRYLFEYVKDEHSNLIKAVWLSPKRETVAFVKSLGYEAYSTKSLKGIYYALRAGVAFYSHALIDFGLFPLVGGSFIVSLWHGVGFKRIYNANYHGFRLFLKKMLDKCFSWTYRNMTTVTSEFIKQQFSELFSLNSESLICITGQPRNDIFKRELTKDNILNKLNIDSSKKLILYMPTYRHTTLGKDSMERIVKDLYTNKKLNKVLDDGNAILVVKLHPLTPHVSLAARENFKILDYRDVENNQELLGLADILVTDYSSCFVDFALLNRPIIFYVPDQNDFLEKSEKLDEAFFDIERLSKAVDEDGLVNLLSQPSCKVAEKTNELFEDKSIQGTCYSENVFNAVKRELRI